jgi:hypothetical protein
VSGTPHLRPLSYPQQRMWFLEQLDPGSFTHNAVRAYRLRGVLDVEGLRRALRRLVERHATLRTVVAVVDREPGQRALEEWELPVPVTELDEAELAETLRRLSREPFDLTRELTFRANLFRLGDDDHVLLLRMHHIMGDAASDEIIVRELALLYEDDKAELPPLAAEYADFAAWQREQLQGKRLDELVAHWLYYLEGAPQVTKLPLDRPRPAIQRHVGVHYELTLPAELRHGVAGLARASAATPFMVLLAGLVTLLYRHGAADDIVLGTPMANRNRVEFQDVVGFFSNTVPVRVRLGGSPSFAEVVARSRAAVVDALAHQELPFEKIVEAMRTPRELAWNPVFQVNFRARADTPPAPRLRGLEVELIPVDIGFSRFDLSLELYPAEQGLGGFFEYDEDLFDRETIAAFAADFEALLTQAVAEPATEILALRLPERAPRAAASTIPRRRR